MISEEDPIALAIALLQDRAIAIAMAAYNGD